MSGIVGAVALATASSLLDVFVKPYRTLDFIVPDCAVEERHSDRLVITEHPVEQGAAISDHAYKLPAELVLRYGWSDSTGGFEQYSIFVYQRLLALQEERRPFVIYTGKRVYPNMLIASIDTSSDAANEHSMVATIVCRQVIIVTTTVTNVPAPSAAQSQNVKPTESQPAVTPAPTAPNSVLHDLFV